MVVINIPEDIVSNIERVYYELQGYKMLINSLVESRFQKYDNEIYEKLMKEFQMKHAEYNLMFKEIVGTYVPGEYRDNGYHIRIDFYLNAAVLTKEVCDECRV